MLLCRRGLRLQNSSIIIDAVMSNSRSVNPDNLCVVIEDLREVLIYSVSDN